MKYRRLKPRWKYQTGADFSIRLPKGIGPRAPGVAATDYIGIYADRMTISEGYAWDGPSGPMRDDETNMTASLVHDALYQLLRLGELKYTKHRKRLVDGLFRDMCLADGMRPRRARLAYRVLQAFGKPKKPNKDRVKWITV